MRTRWYVLQTVPGREKKVRHDLIARLENSDKMRYVPEVVLPTETVTTETHGKKVSKKEKIVAPGYLFVLADLSPVYQVIKGTPGVRGFVGADPLNPNPLTEEQVAAMLGRDPVAAKRRHRHEPAFKTGDTVRIINGPLSDFTGEVTAVDVNGAKLTVALQIFGRITPAEVQWAHVKKES